MAEQKSDTTRGSSIVCRPPDNRLEFVSRTPEAESSDRVLRLPEFIETYLKPASCVAVDTEHSHWPDFAPSLHAATLEAIAVVQINQHSHKEITALLDVLFDKELVLHTAQGDLDLLLHKFVTKPSTVFELRVQMETYQRGPVLGKGGSNINRVRSESNASANVDDRNIITIKGAPRCVAKACGIVAEIYVTIERDAELKQRNSAALKLLLHSAHVAAIQVQNIQDGTGARLQISAEQLPGSMDKLVVVTSTPSQIEAAIEVLAAQLVLLPLPSQTPTPDTTRDSPPPPERATKQIAIPYGSVSSVIGLRGAIIKRIAQLSGCVLAIENEADAHVDVDGKTLVRVATVSGPADKVPFAIELIQLRINGKDLPSGSAPSPPVSPVRNSADDQKHDHVPASPAAAGLKPSETRAETEATPESKTTPESPQSAADTIKRVKDKLKVFDVQTAHELTHPVEARPSLAKVVKAICGVELEKSQTFSDWSAAVFTRAQIDYAKDDVRHLLAVRDKLQPKLETLGRTDWFNSEMKALVADVGVAQDPMKAYKDIRMAYKVPAHGMAVLQELAAFRWKLAERLNQHVRHVHLNEIVLVGLAQIQPVEINDLRLVRDMDRFIAPGNENDQLAIVAAIKRGQERYKSRDHVPDRPMSHPEKLEALDRPGLFQLRESIVAAAGQRFSIAARLLISRDDLYLREIPDNENLWPPQRAVRQALRNVASGPVCDRLSSTLKSCSFHSLIGMLDDKMERVHLPS